ncbi:helix-turn-helix domain-containing protein [Nocardioides sp. cx-173]|uniref:winged helix-turn-helix transcriptional regulator n=1 Tax=Nocardioides sp. cx-173 TaxID=2898796 RepID=UPI001E3EF843|nr:helix-turn-helix domain-containing protein [Nocardioides sp. cx-173]MCD4525867.1 helix-turn-helix transcriptional regulator [Nocardioides sp. cx-173]UGB40019.1 helix-turn-helix transcriptional regulator [Nocardioides sp. cx-173]
MTSTSPTNRRQDHLIDDATCREATAGLEFVGRRWTGAIMLALGRGATRFGEIEAAVDGLSARLLSARLRELEAHDLVAREVIATTPVSVRYRLTPRGRDLLVAMQPLVAYHLRWG